MKSICNLEDLEEVDSLEFALSDGGTEKKCFIVKVRDRIFAYKNCCPHTGAPLNWQENKFLDLFGLNIQCTLHGALFQIEDGLCTWGPCEGQSLKPVDIMVSNGTVYCTAQKKAR